MKSIKLVVTRILLTKEILGQSRYIKDKCKETKTNKTPKVSIPISPVKAQRCNDQQTSDQMVSTMLKWLHRLLTEFLFFHYLMSVYCP